jgi:formate hydrogenlyase subunit 3/multisubunit Na+/H+ antiporter MnhD subunit
MCFFALSKESILAGQVYFLAHSFAKISLFFYAGYLLARYHVSNITELKFRRNHLNIALSILWILPVLSLMSMPMTIGFIGKHSLINGLLFAQTDILFLIIIFVGMMLCIFYIYPIFYHLLIFNNDSRFKGQKIETSCIYIAVISIAVLIIGGFFILHKIV